MSITVAEMASFYDPTTSSVSLIELKHLALYTREGSVKVGRSFIFF